LGVLVLGITLKVFTPCLGVLHVMWSTDGVDDPWLFRDGHAHVEVACSLIARPCMMLMWIYSLEHWRPLDSLVTSSYGHMELSCLLRGHLALEEECWHSIEGC
jgi:hypothetical protein